MSRRTPLDAIADLPDWHGAECVVLDGGVTNRTWRLQKDGRQAVLKIDVRPRAAPFNSRPAEAALQSVAAEAGLANGVLFVDDTRLLCEYVEGTVWNASFFAEKTNLRSLAAALRRLHSLPPSGKTFDPAGAAEQYRPAIAHPDEHWIEFCIDVIASTALPDALCCCHNDLVAENILSTPAIRFLDWEYACDNDPMFDVATIIEHHELSETQAAFLLQAYADGDVEPWRARLRAQRNCYLALLWLWLASRPGACALALDGIARRLATSCS